MIKDLFLFNSMLTPKLITLAYWGLLVCIVIGAAVAFLASNFFYAVGLLVGGTVIARIWCELMIVMFKINENIQKIADNHRAGDTSPINRNDII